jgi:DNA-binding response OmpR family regulator
MTFGVVGKSEPLLSELLVLAFQSAGHDCLILEDTNHATRILQAIHVDSIVLDINTPGRSGIEWLEEMVATWPDLPARTLLFANTALTAEMAARIEKLGADVVVRPLSIIAVERVVLGRVEKAQFVRAGHTRRGPERDSRAELVH